MNLTFAGVWDLIGGPLLVGLACHREGGVEGLIGSLERFSKGFALVTEI